MSGKLPTLGVLLLFCMGTISNASDTRVIGTSNTLPGEGTMSSPYQLTVNCGASSTDSFNYTLPASTSKYFALSVAKDSCASPSPAHSPRFIEVYMERTTPNGDPDLHVTACPTQTATSFPTIHYQDCNVSIGRDMTSQAVHSVSAAIGTWADTQDKMTFLVEIRGYGNTETAFSMNAVSTTCHASVMWEPLSVDECGGDQRGTCSAAGECACKQASAPYPPTDHWVLDDCSALERPEIVLNKASNYTVNHGITNFVPFQVRGHNVHSIWSCALLSSGPKQYI